MGCGERYTRNRSLTQTVTNYLGFIGSVFFALQNLSTNWGGDFRDDNSLTDTVKAHNLAGTAWDEQHLQVGALLIAWSFYVLGAELQGNMNPGRYKRTMTWMLNFPSLVFFIGNMILSSRRNSDGVQTDGTLAWDISIGVVFIILLLVNTAIYATSPRYSQEKWLNIVEGEVVDNPREDPIDPKAFSNNRFWLQGLLHLIAIACLMYFCIVGLANYDNNKGWLLTDLYKADPFVVKVWDIGGASVGMLALPLMLMFVGLELQGDLPPSNYKPLSVFVGAVNIFTSSIFLYATNWDAYDRGVITSHAAPLVIMLILCILAIIVVVCYGVMVPYSDAVWIKVLADPWEVGYGQNKDAHPAPGYAFGGSGDVEAKPDDQPDPEQGKALGSPPRDDVHDDAEDPGGMTAMEDEEDAARRAALLNRNRDAGRDPNWIITPRVEEEDLADIIVSWDAPPGTNEDDVEYRVDVTDVESGNIGHETVILPGDRRQYMIDEVAGEPIIPGEHFHIHVQWRYKSDADNADEGWQGYSGETQVATAEQTEPVALLRSRTPRVHLRNPIGFKSNHHEIRKGSEALPALAQLLQDNPDMTLGVDGHVNFGQSEAAALRLSQARAEEVCDALQELGADRSRLVAAGYGWNRPRFPRVSKFAGRNRRVEFRVLPGSGLYERLRSEAVARRNSVNGPEEQLKTFSTRNLLSAQQPAPPSSVPRPASGSSLGTGAGAGAGAGASSWREPTPLPPAKESGKADATSAAEAVTASPGHD